MKLPTPVRAGPAGGFTLMELLIATSLIALIVAAAVTVSITQRNLADATALRMEADHDLNMAISRFVYGSGLRRGIRSASSASLTSAGRDWTLTYVAGSTGNQQTNQFRFQASRSNILFNPGGIVIGENISSSQVAIAGANVTVTMRVDRARGRHTAFRAGGTTLRMRNQ